MINGKLIKNIYGISDDFLPNDDYDEWYKVMLNKRIIDLNSKDVYRMIRQEILVELAIEVICIMLCDNIMVGEMYEGQFLELLSELSAEQLGANYKMVCSTFETVEKKFNDYQFESEDSKVEYKETLERLHSIVKIIEPCSSSGNKGRQSR